MMMENVYDLRRKEKLNFILPDDILCDKKTVILKGEMAIIIHLHYEDTVERYFDYLVNVPEQVDIYISTSESLTKGKIEENIEKYKLSNCAIIEKANRGRDISALLVACRDVIAKYEYICFLHDKKGRTIYDSRFKEEWIVSMWENMISSNKYIHNVKYTFDNNKKVGILSVPEQFGLEFCPAFDNAWCKNFDMAVALAEKLQLNCNMDRKISPITLGTIFWCRTVALKKLFAFPWKYEDFPDEPMPNDGTVSHAIERILAYVAQDAGYYTGSIRTMKCAETQLGDMQYYLQKAFVCMKERMGVWNMDGVLHYDERKRKCVSFAQKHDVIYLYGAGMSGKQCLCMLKEDNITPRAIFVTKKEDDIKEFMGIPLLEFEADLLNENVGIIISVTEKFRNDIEEILEKQGFHDYMWMMQG